MRAIISMTLASIALAEPAFAQDKSAIQNLNDKFERAFEAGDLETIAGMYTEGAYVLPPGAPLVHGRADIRTFWDGARKQVRKLSLQTVDVTSLGPETAREIGTFALTPQGHKAEHVSGK